MNKIAQDHCQIVITGELNIYTATEWRDRLIVEAAGHSDIELDLGNVDEIDCAGFQLLLSLKRLAGHEGRELKLSRCSASVRSLLEFTGQTHLFSKRDGCTGNEEEQA